MSSADWPSQLVTTAHIAPTGSVLPAQLDTITAPWLVDHCILHPQKVFPWSLVQKCVSRNADSLRLPCVVPSHVRESIDLLTR